MSDPSFDIEKISIRLAEADDHAPVRQIFDESVLEGHLAENDTGADIEDLDAAYFADQGASAFWVACADDMVIGMIGVQCMSEDSAEMRRLRVRNAYRRNGVGSRLIEHATEFCRKQGYLKVVLDVRIERAPAITMFEKFGFSLSRTRDINGRKLLDFYMDLYSEI